MRRIVANRSYAQVLKAGGAGNQVNPMDETMRKPISLFPAVPSGGPLPSSPEQIFLPDAYRLPDGAERGARMDALAAHGFHRGHEPV